MLRECRSRNSLSRMSRPSSIPGWLRANGWLGMLLLGAAFLWGCFDAPFFGLDDEVYLERNRLLTPETPWHQLFLLHGDQNFYYPVTLISWRLERPIWEAMLTPLAGVNAWPAGVRLGNLLCHLAAAVMVLLILRRLRVPATIAAFVMVAFALHPYACEVVCWPIERKSALACFLGFASLLLYMRAGTWKGYALASTCYCAALFSKPSALGIFAVAVVWEILGRPAYAAEKDPDCPSTPEDNLLSPQESDAGVGSPFAILLRLSPWALLSAVGIWTGYQAHSVNVLAPPGGSLWTAVLTDQVIIVKYFLVQIWPECVSAYYFVDPVISLLDARLWISIAIIAGPVSASLLLAERSARRLVCFAWLWFLGALGPHLNLVALTDLMHDRFLYLSVPGFWLAIGLAIDGATGRATSATRRPPKWCGVVAVILPGVLWTAWTLDRSQLFREARLLWADAAAKEPKSAYAHLMHAIALQNAAVLKHASGHGSDATRLLSQARTGYEVGMSAPDFHRYLFKISAHADLAYILYKQNNLAGSKQQALEALAQYRIEKTHKAIASKAIQILGMIALKEGNPHGALKQFDLALEMEPSREILHFFKGKAYWVLFKESERSGNSDAAADYKDLCRKALKRLPRTSAKYDEAGAILRTILP